MFKIYFNTAKIYICVKLLVLETEVRKKAMLVESEINQSLNTKDAKQTFNAHLNARLE